jgi:hypothetical protein
MLFSFWVWRPGCRGCPRYLGIERSSSIAENRYLGAIVDSIDRAQLKASNNFVSRSAERDFHFHMWVVLVHVVRVQIASGRKKRGLKSVRELAGDMLTPLICG